MQLLYGNDGVNYHTIAKSEEISEQQEKEILENYLGYDFVPESAHYSDVTKEPYSIIYAVTDLAHTLPEENVLFAKSARMSNYLTPSYYAHFQLLKLDKEIISKGFIDLLRSTFIEDKDVTAYLSKDIDTFVPTVDMQAFIDINALKQEQLLPIVASLLNVADSLSQKVQLILDVEGDEYNQHALNVIASVYTCIPYSIRRLLGFSTYAGNGEKSFSNRVKLVLYSREAVGRLGGDYIDLKKMESGQILKKIPENLVKMARIFVYEETAREEWFSSFQALFGAERTTVKDHVVYFENIHKWREQSLDILCDSLAKYAYQEQQKQDTTPLFKMFCSLISQRFEKENFLESYHERIKAMLFRQNSYEFGNDLKAYMILGEVLASVEFNHSIFLMWQQKTVIDVLEEKYEDMELYQQLLRTYHSVQNIKFGGDKCKSIFGVLEDDLRARLNRLQKEIEERISEEQRQFQSFFQSCDIALKSCSQIRKRYAEIVYQKPNEVVFKKVFGEAFKKILSNPDYFPSLEKYVEYKAFVKECADLLIEEDGKVITALIEQKGETVKAMETYSKIIWKNKKDVLEAYCNIVGMEQVSNGKAVTKPDYRLMIAGEEFVLREAELILLIHFVCAPNMKNSQDFETLVLRKKGLVEAMLQIDVFEAEHFDTLLRFAKDKPSVHEKLLQYYVTRGVLLSEETARRSITGIEQYKLNHMLVDTEDKNILTTEISKKLKQYEQDTKKQGHSDAAWKKARATKIRSIVTLIVAVLFAVLVGTVGIVLQMLTPIPKDVWNIIMMILAIFSAAVMIINLFSHKKNIPLLGIGISLLLIVAVLGGSRLFLEKREYSQQGESTVESNSGNVMNEIQSGQ